MTGPLYIVMLFTLVINNVVVEGPNLAFTSKEYKTEAQCKAEYKVITDGFIKNIKEVKPGAEVKTLGLCATKDQAEYMQSVVTQMNGLRNFIRGQQKKNQI